VVRVIPRPDGPVSATVLSSNTLASVEIQLLIARLHALNKERSARCIGLVSATAGEGKTTLSMGLAFGLALEPERRVLLVEADTHKSALEDYLGLPYASGLSEWLTSVDSSVPLRWVTPPGFALLSRGTTPLGRRELLGSKRMASLLQAAREEFDFVIVDCPPVSSLPDSIILQDLLDGFLVVVRARHTPRESLVRAAGQLNSARILGTVFNAQNDLLPRYENYGQRQLGRSHEE
jgi:capsular exopolysaccharide synthesis family protein